MPERDDTTTTFHFTDEDETLVINYSDDEFLTTNYSQEAWEDSISNFRNSF